ncbi:MAG: hypothetical protein HMLKMBBP_03099 [Planctomycetes bacterium]|nr:hypothetical protein [Planctomycetota bacterium]
MRACGLTTRRVRRKRTVTARRGSAARAGSADFRKFRHGPCVYEGDALGGCDPTRKAGSQPLPSHPSHPERLPPERPSPRRTASITRCPAPDGLARDGLNLPGARCPIRRAGREPSSKTGRSPPRDSCNAGTGSHERRALPFRKAPTRPPRSTPGGRNSDPLPESPEAPDAPGTREDERCREIRASHSARLRAPSRRCACRPRPPHRRRQTPTGWRGASRSSNTRSRRSARETPHASARWTRR